MPMHVALYRQLRWGCTDFKLTVVIFFAKYAIACGDVAQLGERSVRNAEVVGSNPIISTTHSRLISIRSTESVLSDPDNQT